MLNRVYRGSRRIGARLLRKWAPPQRIVHSLPSETAFFSALDGRAAPQIGRAKVSFRDGNRNAAAHLIVSYFRNRPWPYFFISSDEIRKAIGEIKRLRPEWRAHTLRKADDAASGYIDVYAQRARLLSPEDWAFAPLGPGGDILYRERPHRFSFAPRLALAALYEHSHALTILERLVTDWAASVDCQRPFGRKSSLFTASSHVALYRAIAASWTLAFLSALPNESVELELLLLRIIAGDARFIHSEMPETSGNNHLLADGFGLWYLGTLYPEFGGAENWKETGFPVFEEELQRQVYSDGSSFEQSIHYQEHACEMGLAYLLICQKNSISIDADLAKRVEAMLLFQSSLSGKEGRVFSIGDTTEDPLFPLDSEDGWCGPALRCMYAKLFGNPAVSVKASAASLERSFWLGGGALPDVDANASPRTKRVEVFPVGGFALLHAREGRDCLLFRTGPSEGVDLVPGHMHCDYLSIYLVIDGNAIFVPSGTYTYRASAVDWPWPYKRWREYFMSARAANGLSIFGADPLQRGAGEFPGGVRGEVACRVRTAPAVESDSLTLMSAQVVGVGEYAGWARIILQVKDDYWLIVDCLPHGIANAPAWLGMQCAVGASVESHEAQCVRITVDGTRINLSFSAALGNPECLESSSSPRGGWISPSYGRLEMAPQLLFPVKRSAELSAFVVARCGGNMDEIMLTQVSKAASGVKFWIRCSEFEDQVEVPVVSGEAPTHVRWRRLVSGNVVEEENM